MLILQSGEGFPKPCALLMGGFDGLHLGHGALVEAAKGTKLPVGIMTLLGLKGGSLFTRQERELIFDRAGIDFVLELNFEKIKEILAEDFLKGILPVTAVFCGEDFRFGKDALGTPELIKRFADVTVQKTVCTGGEKISASRCKSLLANGDMVALNALLMHPYFLQGVVEHGRQTGRTYGFPTLNLTVPSSKLAPKEGVYGGYVETPKGEYPAIIHLGARPTFGLIESKLEAHLVGFSGDLYGATVRVYPTKFLRPVTRFSSVEELKKQLEKDIKEV